MYILDVKNVSKQYAAHKALDHISLSVPKGSIYGLLGPNGAGKTSLIRIITQITQADEGEVFFDGQLLHPNHIKQIGYLPEERGLYKKMEVGEQLLYFAQLKGLSRADALLKLKDWVEKFEIKGWWKKKVEELSKGMQQKIQFIATVLHEPQLIILDEPFSGFDPINASLITDEILKLKENGSSIIFSTHRMESVEQLCDNIALINQSKKVLDGSVQEIREQFRTHTYEVEHSSDSISLQHGFELIQTIRTKHQSYVSLIKVPSTSANNELLHQLMPQTSIIRFEEKLPDMQQIFISVVNKSVSENKVAAGY
ncbi:MAG: ATP-binding cassette domain-containing protein [Bacteroidota bacterium]